MDPQVSSLANIVHPSHSLQKLQPYPSLATVEQLVIRERRGNCIPIFVQLPADLITPCMAYLRIAQGSKYSFLLESVVAGENIARYSFVGAGESFLARATRTIRPLDRSIEDHQDRSQ